jgi:ligand-binding sensor domain-containing protein
MRLVNAQDRYRPGKNLFLCLVMLLWRMHAPAQIPAYIHYGVQEGMPGNLVYCGIQDQKGLLWFGTDKGLVCFDGVRFRTFGVRDGLIDPEVLNLMEDSAGRLWISSYRKKPCYRYKGRFITEKQDSLLSQMRVQSVLWEFSEDSDKTVWLSGQSDNVWSYSGKELSVQHFGSSVVRPARINGILFYFGINGIFRRLSDGRDTLIRILPDVPTRRDVNPFRSFGISGNRILYSYSDKLLLLEWTGEAFREVARRPGPLGRVFTDKAGRFWVCSLDEGAICFDNDRRDLSNPQHYFKGEKVTAMVEDYQGTFWFCTTDNGIYALPKDVAVNYTTHNGLLSNNITALARNNTGELLSGDDEGNLYTLAKDGSISTLSFGSADGYNRVRRILPARDGSCWVVTDEMLYHVRKNNRAQIAINASPKTAVLDNGWLWCASSGSLFVVEEKSHQIRRILNGRFTALCQDSDNNIWAGTNEGILSERDSFRTDWAERFPDLRGRVIVLENAGKDSLWIATPEKGLMIARVKAGAITSVSTMPERLGAQLENIQSLFAGPNGNLWLATNRGVCRLDKFNNLVRFDHNNGLANDDVNTALNLGDTLWVASVGGLSRLVLRSADALGNFPTFIVNASYRVKDRTNRLFLLDSLPRIDRVAIPPDATLVEIGLAGLDYRSRGNLHYECVVAKKLPSWRWWTFDNLLDRIGRGFRTAYDTTWVNSDQLSFGVHLNPGRYDLLVTAVTPGGVRSLQPDFIILEMRPHWYSTMWFWLLIWGIVAYAAWHFVNERIAFRKLDAAVSELQLQALQSQMNPHFVGNSINAIQQFFYPPDPARASEYIALFTRLLRRTLSFSDLTFISFAEETDYLSDYLNMMKLRFGDFFQFEITGVEDIPPNTPMPTMLLQPLLENATLHGLAPDGVSLLKIDFVMSGGKMVCSITDNGAGLISTRNRPKEPGSAHHSKGLEILYKKVDALNRRFHLGLQIDLHDLSQMTPPLRGTRATVVFYPEKIPVATPAPPPAAARRTTPNPPPQPIE